MCGRTELEFVDRTTAAIVVGRLSAACARQALHKAAAAATTTGGMSALALKVGAGWGAWNDVVLFAVVVVVVVVVVARVSIAIFSFFLLDGCNGYFVFE